MTIENFKLRIGIENNLELNNVTRTASRAIIIKDNKLLLLKSNKGDYKLPGGGVEKNENVHLALIREIEEETGYKCSDVICEVGEVIERKKDLFDENSIFQMTSKYFLCIVDDNFTGSKLTESEKELEMVHEWVACYDAIISNMDVLRAGDALDWVTRELLVLQLIHRDEMSFNQKIREHYRQLKIENYI